MTLQELIAHYNEWAKTCRLTAHKMNFSDESFIAWFRQNAEITMSIMCAQIEINDENPVQAVNMFLVKGWDPEIPEGHIPPDGDQPPPEFEPEDK